MRSRFTHPPRRSKPSGTPSVTGRVLGLVAAIFVALRLAGAAGAQAGDPAARDSATAGASSARAESARVADSLRNRTTDSLRALARASAVDTTRTTDSTLFSDSTLARALAPPPDTIATVPEWRGPFVPETPVVTANGGAPFVAGANGGAPFAVAPGAGGRTAPFGSSLDRTAWVSWTPRVRTLALPRFQYAGELFTDEEASPLRYPVDARAVAVSVDPEAGTVQTSLSAADVPLSPARSVTFEDYARELTASGLRRTWVRESRTRIDNKPADVDAMARQSGYKINLPFELPTAATGVLGRGGPSLNVSGSERISIAGTSNWDNRISGTGVRRSLFPQLDMRQDLDIRLDGSLGDKVRVDVAQNSANTVPLSNRIGIHYTGYDDEILKSVDLGNTNLSLPGTQYVSYSGRNEGLFGAKAAARLGGTDVALIASKQEGRSERKSFQGTAQEVIRQIDDLNYIKGKYFFLQRPTAQLQTNSRIEIGTVKVFVDDKNGNNNQGVRAGFAEIDPAGAPGSSPRIPGEFDGLRELTDYEITFTFYGERFPVLVLKSALSNAQVLGVSYVEVLADGTRRTVGSAPDCSNDPSVPCDSLRLQILQAPRDLLPAAASSDFFETDSTVAPFIVTRDYEIKSFYDLQTTNIDPKSLTFEIRRYDAALEEATDAYKEGTDLFTYLQITGIDLFKDNGSGSPLEGQDQTVDKFTNADFLDVDRGILFFPDLRPFDPRVGPRPDSSPVEEFFFRPRVTGTDQTIPGLRKRIYWPPGLANPPGIPGGGITPVGLESNRNVYDKRNILLINDRKYYIYAKFTGSDFSGTISLGQTGLLEGSEVIAIEGVPLERNKDYTIDYDAGIVTLLTARARENRARLTIDYSFAPLFSQAGRTLVGGAFGYRGIEKSLGGAFIYESKGQQELRPRLGEEPTRTMIGDVYTQFSLKPYALTRLADRLPGYSTTEPSRIDVNAEVGFSMPNPNTKNTIYIDDFEGNRDSYTAAMSRLAWKWPSPPLSIDGALTDTVDADYTELIWYNPVNTVQAADLNPRLSENEGAQNFVNVLDLYIPKAPAVRIHPELWTGITTTVEPDGADFSRMQYLELWINDWRSLDVRGNPNLKLHVDLGIVSEDAQRAPGVSPNELLDSEDKNRDGKYDPSDNPDIREDTGADGIADEREADLYDLSTATDVDKHGDNFQTSPVNLSDETQQIQRYDPLNYIGPTLSEKSKGTYESGSRLFTEDLNSDQSLDRLNSYVRYSLALGDEAALAPYLIFAAESTLTLSGQPVAPNNGWKRYRIPLDVNDSNVRSVIGNGSLATVKHMRVWLEGIESFQGDAAAPKGSEFSDGRQPLIEIAAVDVVGNRWRINALDDATVQANGSVVARNVNNQEDRNIYTPPPGTVQGEGNLGGAEDSQREQSIALEVTRLAVGANALIFKDQLLPEDYTRYSSLGFYLAQFEFQDQDSARFYLRMGYDERNYYEYSRPVRNAPAAPSVPTPWQQIVLNLTDFTSLKLDRPAGSVADTVDRGDERFVVVGSPTFTRIQRLSIGVSSDRAVVDTSTAWRSMNTISGTVWIDDLRALNVERTPGIANRVTVNAKVADLFMFTTNWDRTDENFQRLGQTTGSNINSDRIAFSGTFQPHRFVTTTGVALPISFSYARASSTPRLRTGTDIFLSGSDAEAERSTSVDRSFGVTFSKTGDRNPILKNTIGRATLNFNFADRVSHTPTQADSSRTLSGGGSYSIAPAEWFAVPVPGLKTRAGGRHKFQILPQSASIAFAMTTTRSFVYKRSLDDAVDAYSLQSDVYRKTALYQLGASWRPLPFGSYSLTATRNAFIPGIEPDRILGINFGTMTNFNQRIDGRVVLPVHTFVRPSLDFATSYTEARTPDLSPDLSLGSFTNSTNAGIGWEIPLTRLAGVAKPPTSVNPMPNVPRRTAPGDTAAFDTTRAGVPPGAPGAPGAPVPSGGGFSIPVGRTLSRLGNISLRGTFSRSTAFSRYSGVPSVPYRLGIARDPNTQWNGDEVQSIYRGPQATDNAQRTYSGDASTTVALVGRSTARARLNYTNTNRVYNTQVSNTKNVTFPDLSFEWGSVARVLRLQGMFSALNAQTRWNTVRTTEGANLSNPTSKQFASGFSPLLSLSGQTRGQAQVLFSVDRKKSRRDDFGTRRATRREGQTTLRASINRSYTQGQKVPIFGGSGLKSTLTLQLDGTFDKRTGQTEAFGTSSSKINTDRFDINSSGTYAFSTYVNGTLGLGFSQARDLQIRNVEGDPLVTRSIRLELTGSVRF
ncbi:MAG: cell surface protein SprA [Candidatus Eiseniibacteriota bacterium]